VNWVDLVIVAVIAISALLAFMRGLVREVMGVGAWIGAALFTFWASPLVEPRVATWLGSGDYSKPVAYLICFLVSLVLLMIVAGMIGSVVRGSLLSGIDRTLGVVFGAVRGAALMAAAYLIVGLLVVPDRWPDPVKQAGLLPYVYTGAGWLADCLPPTMRPHVVDLPKGREINSNDLLHLPATGRATGRAGGLPGGQSGTPAKESL
jgi:membrane protein required for colicin V production